MGYVGRYRQADFKYPTLKLAVVNPKSVFHFKKYNEGKNIYIEIGHNSTDVSYSVRYQHRSTNAYRKNDTSISLHAWVEVQISIARGARPLLTQPSPARPGPARLTVTPVLP